MMAADMKVNFLMAASMVKAFIIGLINLLTKENGKTTNSTDLVNTYGVMAGSTKVIGKTIKCMGKESWSMAMDVGILESISMIRNMVKVSFLGPPVRNMMVVGKMESNMELLHLLVKLAKPKMENGKMEKELDG